MGFLHGVFTWSFHKGFSQVGFSLQFLWAAILIGGSYRLFKGVDGGGWGWMGMEGGGWRWVRKENKV
jgi:hypothetical protein